jgi:amidase
MVTTRPGPPQGDDSGAWVPHGHFVLNGAADGGPLSGLAFVVKDLFDVAGHPTGAGNPDWLASHPVPTAHAPLVAQLLAAGATLWGKVLTDELAYSLHGDNIHYGTPRNPRAPDRVTGGSSSGSAAAVAAGLVDFALASDTGGSTRVPASYCGLWGLRTTHGALSTLGMVPLHPGFDTATWLAATPEVFEAVGAVVLPPGPALPASWPSRLRVFDDTWALADPDFAEALTCVTAALALRLGVQPQHGPAAGHSTLTTWRKAYVTAGAHEGWRTHGAWIEKQRPTFAPAVAARWAAASRIGEADAAAARELVAVIRAQVRADLGDDAIAVLPSAASIAPRLDADPAAVDAVRERTLSITCIASLAGLPQVSLPLVSSRGLPLGVSLIGPPGSDAALIRLATTLYADLPPALRGVG